MNTRRVATRTLTLILVAISIVALNTRRAQAGGRPPSRSTDTFAVDFDGCIESIGVTLVPTASARAYVPNHFILAGEGQPVTPLVVRTARCASVAVAGEKARPGEIVQIGAIIIPPDGTGDINNYTIWYYTSDPKLTTQLRKAGIDAQQVPTIDYNYQAANNSFTVHVPRPGNPQFDLAGTVQPSPNPAGSFLANWWQQTADGIIKMGTNVPAINIGGAYLILTTDPNDVLGQLLGGPSTDFPIIQQFNGFATARMAVNPVPSVAVTFPAELTWGPQGITLPVGAEMISPNQLADFAAQEGFQFITHDSMDSAAAQARARVDSAKRLVDGLAASNPALASLVPVAPRETDTLHRTGDGNYRLTLGDEDFILQAWGRNLEGQVGSGASVDMTPAPVPGLSNVIAIDAGGFHSLALKSDGTVWAWGSQTDGQLGNGVSGGALSPQFDPVQVGVGVPNFNNIVAVSAGETHSVALKLGFFRFVFREKIYDYNSRHDYRSFWSKK